MPDNDDGGGGGGDVPFTASNSYVWYRKFFNIYLEKKGKKMTLDTQIRPNRSFNFDTKHLLSSFMNPRISKPLKQKHKTQISTAARQVI